MALVGPDLAGVDPLAGMRTVMAATRCEWGVASMTTLMIRPLPCSERTGEGLDASDPSSKNQVMDVMRTLVRLD